MAITQGNTGSGGAGGSVTVTSLPSTPAGTNTIGKVDQGAGGASAWKVDGSGVVQPVSGTVAVSSLPALPAGANAIGTVTANAGTGTFNMQATAASPGSVELSDGASFYTAAKTGQLPAALVSSRLDVNLGAAPAIVTVQGGAAAGAAVAGNPVLSGGSDGTNAQTLAVIKDGTIITLANTAAIPMLGVNASNQAKVIGAAVQSTDGQSAGSFVALAINAMQQVCNGASLDRLRNNVDATLLASAARTTTQGPTTLTTYNLGAVIFVLDMTTVGTGSVTLTISEVDPASGKSILLLSGAAVTTNSTNVYTIDPMLTAAANSIAKARTTRTLSWTVTANNANTATYSLGAMELMP